MATAKGSQAQLVLIEEAVFGTTPGTPSGHKLPISSIGGDWFKQNLIDNNEIRGDRNPASPVLGNVSVAGNFTHPLHLDAFGFIQKHAIGVPVTTGADPYEHLSKVGFDEAVAGDLPPGLSLEIGYTDLAHYQIMTGCKINTLGVDVSSEGVTSFDIGIVGQDFAASGTPADASPAVFASTVLGNFSAAIEEGGAAIAYVTAADFTLNNNIDTGLYVVGGSGQVAELPEGIASLSGNITALFQSSDLLDKAIGATETSLKMTWTQGSHSLEFLIPEMQYEPKAPSISGEKGVLITLPFKAFYTDSTEATILQSTLTNDVVSY